MLTILTLLLYQQENRITAWKFCYLLHKVLREGHPLCCQHSMRHRTMLSELGKLWVIFQQTKKNLTFYNFCNSINDLIICAFNSGPFE